MRKKVIIIGAGLAGLSAGCYAQINGYDTIIFEHHIKAGGVATAWQRKDYLIDGGIHFLTGFEPGSSLHSFFRETGITEGVPVKQMHEYGRYIDELTGKRIDVTRDLDRLAADLKKVSPGDSPFIERFIKDVRAFQRGNSSEFGMEKPPELTTPLDGLKLMWTMRCILRYFSGRYARSIDEYVRDIREPVLTDFFRNLFIPSVPAWFIIMLIALLAKGQMGVLTGGCSDLVGAMESRYRELGGDISYGSTVREITVENDRATGIRLEDGTMHAADFIVSAADGYSTIFEMLGGRYIDEKIQKMYHEWRLFQPVVMISYGVKREFNDEPSASIIMLEHPFTVGNRPVEMLTIRIFNYSDRFAPQGKTVVQAMFDSDWDYWYSLYTDDKASYKKEKSRVAAEVLERLQKHYPGIASQVEVTDVATPCTTWRYTLNRRGSYEGWLMKSDTMMERIGRTLPGLTGFFMAGQWVMPGGGVVPSLYSGRHAVQLICRDDKKRFTV